MAPMRTTRREFVSGVAAASAVAAASGVAAGAAARPAPAAPARPVVKPPPLRPGDTVGIVAPATATFDGVDIDIAEDTMRAIGLTPRLGAHVLKRHGYLAGTDEQRAADVNAMFKDPSVRGIVALRGGWGCSRVLPYLDYDAIAANPKVLTGYSDITALLAGIHAKTGLVTFHGPVGVSRWTEYALDATRRILFDGQAVLHANLREVKPDELVQRDLRVRTITPGRATGRLIGGNLTVLTAILGSPYMPDCSGAILFLEDTDEEPYRIDRMMTQLKLAGVLAQVRAVVFGQCTDCEPRKGTYGSLTLEEILVDHVKPLGIPAWHGAMIGHIARQFTLPLGIEAEVDAQAGTIRMIEAATE